MTNKTIKYQCLACGLEFDMDDASPFCPACENTSFDILDMEEDEEWHTEKINALYVYQKFQLVNIS